jgi:hypothetical protein
MTVRRPDAVLVLCPVDVDVTIARIRVFVVQPVEPKNTRGNKIFRLGKWILGA